ncbi:MAG TPA: signal recognition particle-docking protein FtsY [Actinobacteria bacterium]|jgi:fused signal recognition particle receptor|nr:signal recognition particle-docking protein FtsY [Actinomycetota bacterium]
MFKLFKNLNYIWNKFTKAGEDFWNLLEEELILGNISFETADMLIGRLKEYSYKENISDPSLLKNRLKNYVLDILRTDEGREKLSIGLSKPSVFLITGVNGVGKTSSIAKLANLLAKKGHKIIISAADTFRAAAIEQIQYFGEKMGIEVVHHQRFSDPGAVVFDSLDKAIAKEADIVLIDTAGRMQTSSNLMDELKKIKRVIEKKIGREPDETLLVIDSNVGQNAKSQAEIFNDSIGVTGIILTKIDSTSKGGIVITIKNDLKIPVKLVTYGEKIDDIDYFNPIEFVNELIG